MVKLFLCVCGGGGSCKSFQDLLQNQQTLSWKYVFVKSPVEDGGTIPLAEDCSTKTRQRRVSLPVCVRWAALRAGRAHQSIKAGLWRRVEQQPGHKLVRLIYSHAIEKNTATVVKLFSWPLFFHFSHVLSPCTVSVCDTPRSQPAFLKVAAAFKAHLVNFGLNVLCMSWRIVLVSIKPLSNWWFVLKDTEQLCFM